MTAPQAAVSSLRVSEEAVAETPGSLLRVGDDAGDRCLVCFGGLNLGMGLPVFEFFRTVKDLPVTKLFVRDLEQSWYHLGLSGLSRSIPESVAVIRQAVPEGARRVVLAGVSMGGFAAIMFGALLGADRALAFSPQTFIDPWNRLRWQDGRWKRTIVRMYLRGLLRPKCWDLRRLLARSTRAGRIELHYGRQDRLDLVHARHLPPNHVTHVPYEDCQHNVVQHLRNAGLLRPMLEQALFE
jgi:hypothetical protein